MHICGDIRSRGANRGTLWSASAAGDSASVTAACIEISVRARSRRTVDATMLRTRVAARRAPARAIRLQRRTFLGGALEIDHEAILAAKKRRRLRSFVLGALQPRDTDLAAIRAAEDALAGFAPSGVFSKKATLEAAVGEAESVLLALPELSQLKLDLMSFEPPAAQPPEVPSS